MYFPFAKDEAGQKAPYKIEKMKYYLIAGEPSGDLHGANLIRGLQKADPGAEFRFWGGDCMAAAGGAENLRKHYRETSFFGIVQVLKNLGTIRRQMRECQADVAEFAPDVLILVDYPGFNMKMARWAKEHGIRTFYYIAPKVWAWREWRVKAIRRYVDRLFIIFPFERTYFPKHGITPVFEGNPLVDAIEARRTTLPTPEEFRRRIDNGEFLEYEEVYKDRFYGTLKEQVERQSAQGDNVVFDVDVKGGCNIKKYYGSRALSIFIQPPSIDELRRRLEGRGTDAPEVIDDRIARAEFELTFAGQFDRVVVNDDLQKAEEETLAIVKEFLGL